MEPSGQDVDFLDIKLSLSTGEYRPYAKPNNKLLYINTSSNHPPMVIRNITKGIATRLTTISSSREIFEKEKEPYKEALKKAGHKEELNYREEIAEKLKAESEEINNGEKNNRKKQTKKERGT